MTKPGKKTQSLTATLNPMKLDFTIENHGSILLFRPNTPAAKTWLRETAPEDAQFLGNAMAVEPRYVMNVATAIMADGFSIRAPGDGE